MIQTSLILRSEKEMFDEELLYLSKNYDLKVVSEN